MRIVFVVHTFFPNWTAGTEVYTRSLAKKAIQKGHEARVVCYEPPGENVSGIRVFDTVYDGIPVHRISFQKDERHFALKEYFHREVESHLIAYLSAIQPDIVHVVHAMHLSTASIWAAKKLGLPVVCTATDFWYICPTYQLLKWDESLCKGPHPLTCLACVTGGRAGSLLRAVAARKWLARVVSPALVQLGRHSLLPWRWIANLVGLAERPDWMRRTLAQVDVFLAPTPNTHRLLRAQGLKPLDLLVSGFGLDAHASQARPTRQKSPVLRVGYVGTFRHSKGVHVLIEALRHLPSDKVRLEIYGKPGHFPEYDQQLRRLAEGLDNVSFQGSFPNEKLPEVFAGFDVLAIPALWHENSPLVLLSAFALKTPVIASNVGSLADLVGHEKSGLLFEMGNARDLAAQLQRLVNDPEMIERLRGGIPNVKTVDQNVEELFDIYAGLLRGSKAARSPELVAGPVSRASWSGALVKSVKMLRFGARFGKDLTLLRFKGRLVNERELCLDFQWHAPEVRPECVVFVHFLDENGHTQIQADHPLANREQDARGFLAYQIKLWIAESHLGKDYRVRLGVYIAAEKTRLPVTGSRGLRVERQESAVSPGAMRMTA